MQPPAEGTDGGASDGEEDEGRSTAFWIAIAVVLAIPVLIVGTILLAVIGAFVLGIGGDVPEQPQIGWETEEGNASVTFAVVSVTGSQPAGSLHAEVGGESAPVPGAYPVELEDEIVVARSGGDVAVGDESDWQAGERVRLVWVAPDGTDRQVLGQHVLLR